MKKILIILTALSLIGCGSSKVEKSNESLKYKESDTEKNSTTKLDTSKIETTKTESGIINIESLISSYEFEPFDNTKPFFVNGKKFENVKVKSKEEKTITKEELEKQMTSLEQRYLNELNENYKDYIKEIEAIKNDKKTEISEPIWLYIIIALFVIVILWYISKRLPKF